ncbi:glycosyltransferase [Paracoccus sp. MC1854]
MAGLATDPARRVAIGEATRDHVLRYHSWGSIARDLLARAGIGP